MIIVAIKLLATALIAWNLRNIYRAWRSGKFDMDYLWMLGLIVFGIVAQWVSGLALIFAWTSLLTCFVALMIAVLRIRREAKQADAELAALLAEHQRIVSDIHRHHQELMLLQSQMAEEGSDDQCI